ncbi:hypothetical protein HK100_000485 [Physocladia obscura]|uniref:Uncharacterized protein n=1 Tax=Physocladia obscura TaxID=109957 RepID=A0AAD5XLE2_9FUNG|nr:hypothetical protein HK100_000485 [Physocladia obscura]
MVLIATALLAQRLHDMLYTDGGTASTNKTNSDSDSYSRSNSNSVVLPVDIATVLRRPSALLPSLSKSSADPSDQLVTHNSFPVPVALPTATTALANAPAVAAALRALLLKITPSIIATQTPVAPIEYYHVWGTDCLTMCIFVLKKGATLPIHSHPNMTVFSRVVEGDLHVKTFSILDGNQLDSENDGKDLVPQFLDINDTITENFHMIAESIQDNLENSLQVIQDGNITATILPTTPATTESSFVSKEDESLKSSTVWPPSTTNNSAARSPEHKDSFFPGKMIRDAIISGDAPGYDSILEINNATPNLHSFTAASDHVIIFDLLFPPYDENVRTCTYYRPSGDNNDNTDFDEFDYSDTSVANVKKAEDTVDNADVVSVQMERMHFMERDGGDGDIDYRDGSFEATPPTATVAAGKEFEEKKKRKDLFGGGSGNRGNALHLVELDYQDEIESVKYVGQQVRWEQLERGQNLTDAELTQLGARVCALVDKMQGNHAGGVSANFVSGSQRGTPPKQ